jgi:mono/diheme cytochrome c family protein
MKLARIGLTLLFAALVHACSFGAEDSWQQRVPAAAISRSNPFEGKPEAVAAGRKLFVDHCAQCHGENAEGTRKKPSLHSERIRDARDGELEWFLANGNPAKGMPSWSKLPDQQRWQIVRYLKSLDLNPGTEPQDQGPK